jgi:hypothetical protein
MQIGDAAETHDADLDHGAASGARVRYADVACTADKGNKAMPEIYVHAIRIARRSDAA